MAYDEELAQRVREVIATRAEFDEVKMFGGLCFMVNTHMTVGVTEHGLLLKVGKELVDDAVARGGTVPMMGERVMTGVVRIDEDVIARDGIEAWVLPRIEVALGLPPKPPKKRAKRARAVT
jgi:TfoX/Sxy family transcriptional regulator of competence genes